MHLRHEKYSLLKLPDAGRACWVGVLLAEASSWYSLWLQLTPFKSCTTFVTVLTCSLSLCSCALFFFDWVMNFRKWLTSHHLNSKHLLLNNLVTGEHCRQYETSWFFFCNFCVCLWKHVTAVMKNWQNCYKICSFHLTYLSQFGKQKFLFSGSIVSFRGMENSKWRLYFFIQVTTWFFRCFLPQGPLKRKIPSISLLVVDSFPKVI